VKAVAVGEETVKQPVKPMTVVTGEFLGQQWPLLRRLCQ
jgi:hypothetical protein